MAMPLGLWYERQAKSLQDKLVKQSTVAPVNLPYMTACTYLPLSPRIDVDVTKLCIQSALAYKRVDEVAKTNLNVSGTVEACSAASVTSLINALTSAVPGDYSAAVNAGLSLHPDHQGDDAAITVDMRKAALRTALAYVMIARDTMAESGPLWGKATPPEDVDLFPVSVFQPRGMPSPKPLSPPPQPKPNAMSDAETIAALRAQLATSSHAHSAHSSNRGSLYEHADLADRAAKRRRSDMDEAAFKHSLGAGMYNGYGELGIASALSATTRKRLPAQLEAFVFAGQFGFQMSRVKKLVLKNAHGSHNISDSPSRTLKLETGEVDSSLAKFLPWSELQDALRMFITSWLSQFGSERQSRALLNYEEYLRGVQLRWPLRSTAAAEVDYFYRHNLSTVLSSSGTVALAQDGTRSLPDWILDAETEKLVLGVPFQQTLPFCSSCYAAHADPGSCGGTTAANRTPLTSTKTKGGTTNPCFGFNKNGACKVPDCTYPHVCAVCTATDHHAAICTLPGGGTDYSPRKK